MKKIVVRAPVLAMAWATRAFARVAFVIVAVLGVLTVPSRPPAPFGLVGASTASAAVIDTVVWNGSRYYLISENTASGAETKAQALGGHLATITSQEEHDFLWNTWGGSLGTGLGLWIGLTDRTAERNHIWLSGEPVTFTNWRTGEPSNGRGQYKEDFVTMDSRYGPTGVWNDVPDAGPGWRPARGIVKVTLPVFLGPASAISLLVPPPTAGTVTIRGTGDPAATLGILINDVAVQTCGGSPCSYPWNTGEPSTPSSKVVAKAYDATNRVVGKATVIGLPRAFVSVAVPSPASGVVAIQATADPSSRVDIKIDGTVVATCPGSTCSYSWDTATTANGSHTIGVTGHDGLSSTELVADVQTTVANSTVSLSLLPPAAGTVTIQGAANPAAKLRISIDGQHVQTCAGSLCSHAWNAEEVAAPPPRVAARSLDTVNRVLGEAWVTGLLQAFVSVDVQAIPSQASGVVAIQAKAEPSRSVDIRLDGTLLKNCPGTACSYSWDTTTVANGSHVISVKGHNEPYASEMVAYVKITVANGTTGTGSGNASSGNSSAGSATGPTCPTGSTTGSTAGTSSSDSDDGSLVDSNVYQVPDVPRPEFCQPMRDPVFGATITRVTDPVMGSARGYRHEYARLAAVSADNTKAVVSRMSNGSYQVLELATGNLLKAVPGVPCGRDPSLAWHRQDPDLLIFLCGNQVRTFRVSTGVVTTLMTFAEYKRVETMQEGTVSDDWGSVALFATRPDGSMEVVVADLTTQTIIARDSSIAFGNWIGISPSGQYVVIQHMGTIGTRVYDRNLTYLWTLHLDAAHSDFAIDEDGQDVLVWLAKTAAQSAPFDGRSVIAKGRLSDGQTTEIIDTHWKWGGHVSGVGSRGRPGWILVSDYKGVTAPPNAWPFQREIFWLRMDGSGAVRRLAHHHSDQGQCNGGKDYFAEPHAVASWDGTRVLFASIWGDSCTRYDTYVIDSSWLP